jgi:BirA family biotin operon repressor/biotin-[acetyl-CoA-carboxylase] ligase
MELTAIHKAILKRMAKGHFFSGQELANELNVSRASIWNYLKKLEAAGFEFHAVKGKGTRLKRPIELLDKQQIISSVSAERRHLLQHLDLLDICPSTNLHIAQQHSLKPLPNGAICMAEMQTMGRGRLGKTWVSPYGQNLYVSFLWNFKGGVSTLSGLSLACGVAVCHALKELGMSGHGLKWPNDVLWEGKKLGGILVDIQGESQGGYTAVVGIGLNYQMNSAASNEIDQPWTDVHKACGGTIGRNKLAACLLEHVLYVLHGYEEGGLLPHVGPWNDYDCYRGQPVRIISGGQFEEGVANGISNTGELLLLKANGSVKNIMSGEVSLRLRDT